MGFLYQSGGNLAECLGMGRSVANASAESPVTMDSTNKFLPPVEMTPYRPSTVSSEILTPHDIDKHAIRTGELVPAMAT
jgi:hypothetical protein